MTGTRMISLALAAALSLPAQFGPYSPHPMPPVTFNDSARLYSLIRAGNLYLSLQDAIALALENNLDVELQRFKIPIARTEVLRAKGGGVTRGLPLTVAEVPPGVGGPGAPLLNAAASGTVAPTGSIITSVSSLFPITGGATNLSISSAGFSPGTLPPQYDPILTGQLNWLRQSTPQANIVVVGTPALTLRSTTGILGFNQGFSPGTQVRFTTTEADQSTNSVRSIFNPFTTANGNLNIIQPLLRGFGVRVNRRFIQIAENERKLADLVFRAQLIATVSGIETLYWDLVSLIQDRDVRRQTLALARQQYENVRLQVEQGTMAPLELTRAEAFIAAARQDLANGEGFVAQQQLILKALLSKRATADPILASATIIPIDPIPAPAVEPVRPVQDLVADAFANRPELQAAGLQLDIAGLNLLGSRNALLPEVDLVATLGGAGLAGQFNPQSLASQLQPGTTPVTPAGLSIGGLWTSLGQFFRGDFPTYGIGLQVTLPLRNRIAQADYTRDNIQLRQAQVRAQQLQNQVRLEVENALVVMNRARSAMEAALESASLQEQSLAMEEKRYAVGLSTNFLVLQYQSLLAQARSSAVAARSTYIKALEALRRATGATLQSQGISGDEAYRGQIARPPSPLPPPGTVVPPPFNPPPAAPMPSPAQPAPSTTLPPPTPPQ
jgi:outer membrane protein TolC